MADTPAPAKDGRVFDVGGVQNIDGTDYEVTAVSYREDDKGNRNSFTYAFRTKAEMDAERKAQADAEAAAAKEQETAAPATDKTTTDNAI